MKITTAAQLENTFVQVHGIENSTAVQNTLFRLGFAWVSGPYVSDLDMRSISIWEGGALGLSLEDPMVYQRHDSCKHLKEVFFYDGAFNSEPGMHDVPVEEYNPKDPSHTGKFGCSSSSVGPVFNLKHFISKVAAAIFA